MAAGPTASAMLTFAPMETVQGARPAFRVARRGPFGLIVEALREIRSRQRLVRYLVKADLTKKGANTLLGNVWWVLDPLLQMAVYVVFITIVVGNRTEGYPLFIFCAILPWKWFTTSVGDGITSVTSQERIIKQVQFPKIVLPLAAVVSGIGSFAFGLIPLVALLVLFYSSHLSAWIVLIPLVAVVQFVFSLALVVFLSAANVFFRDVGNLVRHVLRLWFYLSPALYGASQIEKVDAKGGMVATLFNANPWTTLFESYRNLIFYDTAPLWSGLAAVLVASLVLLGLAIIFFKRLEPSFAKVL
jgi:ABC-type polysaccharide/polyol phosphate export permease